MFWPKLAPARDGSSKHQKLLGFSTFEPIVWALIILHSWFGTKPECTMESTGTNVRTHDWHELKYISTDELQESVFGWFTAWSLGFEFRYSYSSRKSPPRPRSSTILHRRLNLCSSVPPPSISHLKFAANLDKWKWTFFFPFLLGRDHFSSVINYTFRIKVLLWCGRPSSCLFSSYSKPHEHYITADA